MMANESYRLGEISLNEGRLSEAFLYFAGAINATPLALVKLSEVVAREGDFSHATYLLEQALIDPRQQPSMYQKTKLYIDCGNLYIKMGDLPKAIEQYELAFGLDPVFERRYLNLKKKAKKEKEVGKKKAKKESKRLLEKAIKENSQSSESYWELAQLKYAQHEFSESEKCYAMALKMSPSVFCERYLLKIERELRIMPPVSRTRLANQYNFILHNETFDRYFDGEFCRGERSSAYFGHANILLYLSQRQTAIQRFLLAVYYADDSEQGQAPLEFLKKLEKYIGSCIFRNISNDYADDLTDKELINLRHGCIKWAGLAFANHDYETVVNIYQLIEDHVDFQWLFDADFFTKIGMAYTKIKDKNLEEALKCYELAGMLSPESLEIKNKIQQLQSLWALRWPGASSPLMYKNAESNNYELSANVSCNRRDSSL